MRTTYAETILKLARLRSYFSLRDAAAVGAPRVVLTRLVRDGRLERVSRGLYRYRESPTSEHEDLVKVAHHSEKGVFCLLTALRFYGITTRLPFGVWIALPNQSKPPRLICPRLHVVRFSGAALSEGVETHVINGFIVRVYSVAKTVADCFRFRHKIGHDVAVDALRQVWIRQLASLEELHYYAHLCRVDRIMQPYLESLIWLKQRPANHSPADFGEAR